MIQQIKWKKIIFWTRMNKFHCNNLNYQITSLVYSDRDVWTGLDNSFWNNKTVPFLRNWVTVSTFYITQFSNTALNLKKTYYFLSVWQLSGCAFWKFGMHLTILSFKIRICKVSRNWRGAKGIVHDKPVPLLPSCHVFFPPL